MHRPSLTLDISRCFTVLVLISLLSLVFLIGYPYDSDFSSIVFCPVAYALALVFVFVGRQSSGIGEIAIIVCYTFRMCILPVLCAYGNFFLEPEKSIYIDNFSYATALMCMEVIIVFLSIRLFCGHASRVGVKIKEVWRSRGNTFFLKLAAIVLLLLAILICILRPQLFTYLHFITAESDAYELIDLTSSLQSLGSVYYLFVLIVLFGRPLVSFILVEYFLRKGGKLGFALAFCVAIINVLILSDRRILSLLIGATCFVQIFLHVKNVRSRKAIVGVIACMGVLTLLVCFDDLNESALIARKFQRYFSGPTLTAIGISVLESFPQTPVDFLSRLFNDSIVLTGLFDSISIDNYTLMLCGPSGKSIWTPMLIGSIQYFGPLGFIVLPLTVWVVARFDYLAQNTHSVMCAMIANYVTISIAVYMVMYTVDLVAYNVIFVGGVYWLMICVNRYLLLNDRRCVL